MNNDLELQNFCRNIRRIREKKRISQSRMAAIMGVSVKTLRKIEAGTVPDRLSMYAVYCLCVYFRISSDDLINGEMEL